ncbi:hypothetical protein EHQ27_03970 [Leptospira wolffii]|uniref:Uncharacterized protein n=1 Tax=Leptospira wolffii TaxID=409998 RepID=A0A2M9ZE52_9LEPT|nr:hypothetical protein [Leptospira wolffii]PJZ66696.1 hypothetical protein CH371_00885 [Leptospira wolffii]TGK61671.1 hypothetical protein EHQ32_02105 [Leptospira wolffii]TGK70215.1 hypothetical protein EHQ35_17520 [Leptospira wolffii]TGK77138.1 hypothetical protein EHQ27_03970 [Leptospira wolffii]TGL31010.1 hypothetical protein EHQ57_06290 [Leptospira wolffii]
MQNIDYSRRLKQSGNRGSVPRQGDSSFPAVQTIQHVRGSNSPIRSFPSSRSIFMVLIGAISLFTGGVVVGLRLDQKEQAFSQNETQSFYNAGRLNRTEASVEQRENSSSENLSGSNGENSSNVPEPNPAPKNNSGAATNGGLKFPARSDKENYFLSIPTEDSVEAMEIGKKLLRARPEFQGRFFRSKQGELFVGYFYGREEAQRALELIRPLNDPIFHRTGIHKLQF